MITSISSSLFIFWFVDFVVDQHKQHNLIISISISTVMSDVNYITVDDRDVDTDRIFTTIKMIMVTMIPNLYLIPEDFESSFSR